MLNYRRYKLEDKENCVMLLQKGHDPNFSIERFEWLHHKNPLAPSNIALATDRNRIVGFYSALKKKALIDGKEYIIARDIDPVVDPNYRGQGVFTKMLDFALENFTDIDFFYNFANRVSAPGYVKRGWRQIGLLRDYVCQLGYDRLLSKQFALQLLSFSRRYKHHSGKIKKITFDMIENGLAFQPIQPTGKIWVKRDLQFLKWRYQSNPMHKYDMHALLNDQGKIETNCISRYFEEKKQLLVLEYIHLNGLDSGLSPYLPFFKEKYKCISTYIWQTSTNSMLNGFITNPTKMKVGQKFFVRKFPNKKVPDLIYDIENWYVSRGDSEIF